MNTDKTRTIGHRKHKGADRPMTANPIGIHKLSYGQLHMRLTPSYPY